MTRDGLRRAVELLPRYTVTSKYTRTGNRCVFNANMYRGDSDLLRTRVRACQNVHVVWLQLNDEMLHLQRQLVYSHLDYFLRRGWKWQNWKPDKLPIIVVLSDGRQLIWNGTHRTTLCRLAGRRARCRVIDLRSGGSSGRAHSKRKIT